MTSWIWINTSFEGFHAYKNAPEEVAFLRNEHRHIFHVKVFIEVFHQDREVEFILFKRDVESIIKNTRLNNLSCEQISDEIHSQLATIYKNRKMKIEVSEDLENGALIEYD